MVNYLGKQDSGQIQAENRLYITRGSCVSLSGFPSEDPEGWRQSETPAAEIFNRCNKRWSFAQAFLGFGDRETSFEKINRLPTTDLMKTMTLDNELQGFILLNSKEDAAIISSLTVARMRTQSLTQHRPKASSGWYLFFLISLCGIFGSGLLLLVYVFNENAHHIFYISIFFGIALMSLLLDWFDQLLPFIRSWENLWNVQKLIIRINLDWPVGDSKSDRKARMLAATIILKQARQYLKWDGCCRYLRFGVRSRIVDKNIVISATLSEKKRQESMERLKNITKFVQKLNEQENVLESHKCRINSANVDTNVTFDRLAPQLFFGLFFIVSLVDYMLLRITSQYDVPLPLYVLAEWILYYTAIMLMIMAIFCNWTKISFACSEKAWVQGLLNVSIVGFFVLIIARKLRPPTEIEIDESGRLKVKERKISDITWHNYHHWNKQIDGIVFTAVISWMMVFFFVVSVSAFAEFANKAEQWGKPFAWVCFFIMAMLILLTPAGIIIDVFGGYFIISINEFTTWRGWQRAILVAFLGIVALHYIGSCFQYLIGKQPFAQHWMNRTFAIEMLATSDAVLGDAHWFKVGLVGFTIPAIGFNLGRMHTEFWTQFWSEWHTWPTSFCLVMFGGILALNRRVCSEEEVNEPCLDLGSPWTTQAIPMLLVMPILTKIIGSSIGANILACSRHTDKYIMAREKWHIVHTLMKVGFVPTKTGWKEDVYELASSTKNGQLSYFERACNLQHQWLEIEKSCSADELAEKLEEFKWRKWIPLRYQDHIKYLLRKVVYMEKNDEDKFKVRFQKTVEQNLGQKPGMWEDVYKNKWKKIFQSILVIILVVCFYFCIFGFYLALDLEELSSQGLGFLSKIEVHYWISAGMFFICSCIYYWNALKKTLLGTLDGLLHFIRCCHVNPNMETTFLTPAKP